MKRTKILRKIVLGSLLTAVCGNAVCSAEGIDMPFFTVDELERVDGTASIDSSKVNHSTKGIYSVDQDFIYSSDVKLDINGFAGAKSNSTESVGIFGTRGTVDIQKLEMNFIDNPDKVHDISIYGIKTYSSGVVKLGDNSKLTMAGNSSKVIKGIYAGNNSTPVAGVIGIGDSFEMNIINYGTGVAYGIQAYDNGTITVGDNLKLFVSGANDTRGVEVGFNSAAVDLGSNADINVSSSSGKATGVFVYGTGAFTADNALKLSVSTENKANNAYGVLVRNAGSNVVLNGAEIVTWQGDRLGGAVYAYDHGSFIGNTGKYSIYGDIISKSGGKIDISANNSSFIEGKIVTGSDAETTIKLADNSLWHVTDTSNVTNLTLDNSVIDMRIGSIFSTLTIENMSGNNGVIKMEIDASQNSDNSDRLYITGTLSGTHHVELYEVNGYTPVGEEGVGTVLATVKVNDGTLVAKDGEGTLYWKRYELNHQETADTSGEYSRDWYLDKVTNTEGTTTSVDTVLSVNALNYHTWRTENDKLMQRMGELRHNGEAEQGVWFKLKGTKISRESNKFGFVNKYSTYELGYDRVAKKMDKMTQYQGVAFTYTDGNSSYNSGSGNNSSKAISFYDTRLCEKGHYLDVVLRVSNMDNDFKVSDTRNNKITGDFNNHGIALSAEYGRKNALKNGWYIEPQAQFSLGYLGGDNYTTSNGIEVSQSGIKSAVGRVGFNIGKELGGKGMVYAKANLLHEFGGDYDVSMCDGRDSVKVDDTFNDTWFEYGIGVAFATGKNSHIYLDVERSAGSDFTKDWQWNIGARWTF